MNLFKRLIAKLRGNEKPLSIYEISDLIVESIRKKGGSVGENVSILNSTIDENNRYLIEIGNNVVLTKTLLLTHDARLLKMTGYIKIGKVVIGDNVFVGMDSIILPGVTIGSNVVIGAGTVVSKDIPDNSVVVGTPMKIIGSYDDLIARRKAQMEHSIVVTSEEYKNEEIRKIFKEKGIGFIKNDTPQKSRLLSPFITLRLTCLAFLRVWQSKPLRIIRSSLSTMARRTTALRFAAPMPSRTAAS